MLEGCAGCLVRRAVRAGCPLVHRTRRAGEFLYLQGEPASQVWFLRSGLVALGRTEPRTGRETVRALRRAGAFLGVEALAGQSYLDTARTLSRAVVCAGAVDAVQRWLGPPESPARFFVERFVQAEADDAVRAARPDGTAEQRVARWLLSERPDGRRPRVPRRLVADLLGMVPETFSRALRKLADAGAVDVTRTSVRISDAPMLERIAAGEGAPIGS